MATKKSFEIKDVMSTEILVPLQPTKKWAVGLVEIKEEGSDKITSKINLRQWYKDKEGAWRPSQVGCTIDLGSFPKITRALGELTKNEKVIQAYNAWRETATKVSTTETKDTTSLAKELVADLKDVGASTEKIREKVIAKFGKEIADKVIPAPKPKAPATDSEAADELESLELPTSSVTNRVGKGKGGKAR